MATTNEQDIYAELGIQRAINAMGNVTLLGGSILSPKVQAANRSESTPKTSFPACSSAGTSTEPM